MIVYDLWKFILIRFVCGGYDGITSLSTVECYCPTTDTWKKVAPMMRYRSAGGVAALRGYVYALGGHDGLSIFDSVERYDPVTDIWTKVKPMLSRRCRLGVATLNGKLYACGGYDGSSFLRSVECYDPTLDIWKIVSPMNVKRSRVALTANMGKVSLITVNFFFTNNYYHSSMQLVAMTANLISVPLKSMILKKTYGRLSLACFIMAEASGAQCYLINSNPPANHNYADLFHITFSSHYSYISHYIVI